MAPRLKASIAELLRLRIADVTSGTKPLSPGVVLHVVDKHNVPIFSHASYPNGSEALFDIFSVTKILCTIAFMQLVDSNTVSLDSASAVQNDLPELCAKKVLVEGKDKDQWKLEALRSKITPRMLLNHTNGTGHSLFNKELADFQELQYNELTNWYGTIRESPLLWQPGTRANYGQGFDWMGVLLQRLTGRPLSYLLHTGIYEKMDLKRSGHREKRKDPDYRLPEVKTTPDGFVAWDFASSQESLIPDSHWETGATGVVSCVADLARILVLLLPQNSGQDPVSGKQILSRVSAAEITKSQLSSTLQEHWGSIPSNNRNMFEPVNLQEGHLDPEGSFGLGCAVQGADRKLKNEKLGRSKGSAYWFGAANTEFWVDGRKGIVVVISGNFFPFGDKPWTEFTEEVEGWLYEGLVDEREEAGKE